MQENKRVLRPGAPRLSAYAPEVYEDKIEEAAAEYLEEYHGGRTPEEVREALREPMPFRGLIKYIYRKVFRPGPGEGNPWHEAACNANTWDIGLLDRIWDRYVDLCAEFDQIPLKLQFMTMIGVTNNFFEYVNKIEKIYGSVDRYTADHDIDYHDLINNNEDMDVINNDSISNNKNDNDNIYNFSGINNSMYHDPSFYIVDHNTTPEMFEEMRKRQAADRKNFLKKIDRECEEALAAFVARKNGIGGIFLLKAKHGYRDNAPVEITVKQEGIPEASAAALAQKYGVSASEQLPEFSDYLSEESDGEGEKSV